MVHDIEFKKAPWSPKSERENVNSEEWLFVRKKFSSIKQWLWTVYKHTHTKLKQNTITNGQRPSIMVLRTWTYVTTQLNLNNIPNCIHTGYSFDFSNTYRMHRVYAWRMASDNDQQYIQFTCSRYDFRGINENFAFHKCMHFPYRVLEFCIYLLTIFQYALNMNLAFGDSKLFVVVVYSSN